MGLDGAYVRGNDAIARAAERAGVEDGLVDFVCECTDDTCLARVPLTLWRYREIRARPDLAVVVPDHEPRI